MAVAQKIVILTSECHWEQQVVSVDLTSHGY